MNFRNLMHRSVILAACLGYGVLAAYAQTSIGSGMTCYDARTGKRVSCPQSAPRPVQPSSPRSTNPPPDDSAQIEAQRRSADEKRRREEAERAEAERQRIERELKEKLEREKRDALRSLKGADSEELKLKGASDSLPSPALKGGGTGAATLKDPAAKPTKAADPIGRVDWSNYVLPKLKTAPTAAEISRIEAFLRESQLPSFHYDTTAIRNTWNAIEKRDPNTFALPARRSGKMLERQDFGQQYTNSCAIHALANALGIPYAQVWERTQEILAIAYDNAPDPSRANIDTVMKSGGLQNEEFAVVAESLGRIQVIKQDRFAYEIGAGRPVLVYLAVKGAPEHAGHEVVLDRTFRMNGETWYEMVDSNQSGQWDRRFVSESELKTLLKENGLVVRPEVRPTSGNRVGKKPKKR